MTTMKELLAASVLAISASANATVYNVSGSLTSWSTPIHTASNSGITVSYPGGVPTFSGLFDDATRDFLFYFADFTQHIDAVDGTSSGSSDRTYKGLVYSYISSSGITPPTSALDSYACVGSSLGCGDLHDDSALRQFLAPGITNGSTTSYTFTTNQRWTIFSNSHAPSYFQWNQTFSFTTSHSDLPTTNQ